MRSFDRGWSLSMVGSCSGVFGWFDFASVFVLWIAFNFSFSATSAAGFWGDGFDFVFSLGWFGGSSVILVLHSVDELSDSFSVMAGF